MSIERRSSPGSVLLRSEGGRSPVIRGYAAVFNQWTTLYEDEGVVIRERIMPGAFARALRERQDVLALFNHDKNQLLGRTASGTCRLSVDSRGLVYEVDPPDTAVGRDCLYLIRRGDVTGSSFAFKFRPGGQSVLRYTDKAGRRVVDRDVRDVDLYDVSPVTDPAYKGTDVGLRSEPKATAAEVAYLYLRIRLLSHLDGMVAEAGPS